MHEGVSIDRGEETPVHFRLNERRTWAVVALTAVTMVLEIGVGRWSGSQALEADGWHMGTHAGAISVAGVAYWFARTQSGQTHFVFGTGKVYALAAWTNALVLLVAAAAVVFESMGCLLRPQPVNYTEALPVAVIGFLVNMTSAWLLRSSHSGRYDHHGHPHHGHSHDHQVTGDDHHHDLNLRSAYLHVLMDLLTSLAAIGAIATGYYLGWTRLDPVVGIISGGLIGGWALYLLRDSGRQLLDMAPSAAIISRLRARLEQLNDVRVADVRVWELGFGRSACMLTLVTDIQRSHSVYRNAVHEVTPVERLTIEVHRGSPPSGLA